MATNPALAAVNTAISEEPLPTIRIMSLSPASQHWFDACKNRNSHSVQPPKKSKAEKRAAAKLAEKEFRPGSMFRSGRREAVHDRREKEVEKQKEGDAGNEKDTFTRFSDLPQELQDMIWGHYANISRRPRIVVIGRIEVGSEMKGFNEPIPLLQITHHTRYLALSKLGYHSIPNISHPLPSPYPPPPNNIIFDPKIDLLYFAWPRRISQVQLTLLSDFFTSFSASGCLNLIKSVAYERMEEWGYDGQEFARLGGLELLLCVKNRLWRYVSKGKEKRKLGFQWDRWRVEDVAAHVVGWSSRVDSSAEKVVGRRKKVVVDNGDEEEGVGDEGWVTVEGNGNGEGEGTDDGVVWEERVLPVAPVVRYCHEASWKMDG